MSQPTHLKQSGSPKPKTATSPAPPPGNGSEWTRVHAAAATEKARAPDDHHVVPPERSAEVQGGRGSDARADERLLQQSSLHERGGGIPLPTRIGTTSPTGDADRFVAAGHPTRAGMSAHSILQSTRQWTNSVVVHRQAVTAQREPTAPARKAVGTPADLPPGVTVDVIIVGSPGHAEVSVGHQFQFADAARAHTTPRSVWLVERTGYERGKVPLSEVEQRAGGVPVFWLDESHSLTDLLRSFPSGSIGSLEAYSHGVPGLLALRYGWPGVKNYGLTTAQAKTLSPGAFAEGATLSFDSCNSATVTAGTSLAGAVAQSTERVVTGWTGRTSYHDVNDWAATGATTGGAQVRPSQVFPQGGGVDVKEAGSQLLGRRPERVTLAPTHSSGPFTSSFSITARLPSSRTFPVGPGGEVDITVEAWSEFTGIQGSPVTVVLHRQGGGWFGGDVTAGSFDAKIGAGLSRHTWRGLSAGTYFVEIYHLQTGYLVEGRLSLRPSPAGTGAH